MEKEFNPTMKDLLMLDSLILEIKSKKNKLIDRKLVIQNSLGQYKDKYKDVTFKSKEFDVIKAKREGLKQAFNKIELEIKNLNDELIFKNKLRLEVEFHIKNNISSTPDMDKMKTKLLLMKKKYSDFTKDKTRVASLRIMAAEFVDKIDKILK